MPAKKEIIETLDALNNGKFHVECPHCDEEVKLSEAGQMRKRGQLTG